MKKILILVAASLLLVGCRTRYDIALSNGSRITGVSKPVLDKSTGEYHFKDVKGKDHVIKSMRVIEIAPHESHPSPYRPS